MVSLIVWLLVAYVAVMTAIVVAIGKDIDID